MCNPVKQKQIESCKNFFVALVASFECNKRMGDDELLKYFIEVTDKRLINIEAKLDELLAFRIKIVTAAVIASVITGGLFQIALSFIS